MSKHKNLLLSLIAILTLVIVPVGYEVFAEGEENTQESTTNKEEVLKQYQSSCDVEMLVDKYKLSLEHLDGQRYKISVNGKKSAVGDAEFKVAEVVNGTVYGGIENLGTIKYGQDLIINNAEPAMNNETEENALSIRVTLVKTLDGCLSSDDPTYDGDAKAKNYIGTFHVILKYVGMPSKISDYYKDGSKIPNPHRAQGGICTNFINGYYEPNQFNKDVVIKKDDFEKYNFAAVSEEGKNFYRELIPYCQETEIVDGTQLDDKELVAMIGNAITIWKSYVTPTSGGSQSFNDAFNQIKEAALAAGTNVGTLDNPAAKGTALTYENKCDYKQTEKAEKNYYSAQIVDSQTVKYTYNYAPGDVKEEEETVCNRVCEEAVKVEYGPPVATKAGLCFEYTVKVTSYVKCQANIIPESEPNIFDGKFCTPGGTCVSSEGYVRVNPQAGPNDDFDECIKGCDGGKYTEKCSVKCYKKVYGTSKLKINYLNKTATVKPVANYSVDQCLEENPDGCYIRNNGNTNWKEKGEQGRIFDPEYLARWYEVHNYYVGNVCENCNVPQRYFADADGFKRAAYASTDCTDTCYWHNADCLGQYMNPGSGVADNRRNIALYQSAVTACQASATCSKKTATYTIAVKYDTKDKDGKVTVNKVYYPYTSSAQHKKNPNEGADEYNTIDKDRFVDGKGYKNATSTIIDYNGCYADSDNTRWYLTEWGFPGTYINNKTGEISFTEPDDMSGWSTQNKKFCLPLNARSVNVNWWEYKIIGDTCVTEEKILEELKGKAGTSNGYNIEAITNDFGYFGWNFTTKCFYAIRNEVCDPAEMEGETYNKCCKKKPDEPDDPDDPDDPNCTPGDPDCPRSEETAGYIVRTIDRKNMFPNSGLNVTKEQRREIGFNWTAGASILSSKNTQYHVNPEQLAETIQNNSDTLYTEEPDYQFYLTPADLSKLRQYNDKYSYTSWNGISSNINGVNSYQSNLFRAVGTESNIITESAKKVGTPGVNNE